jgi:hypothetical protein
MSNVIVKAADGKTPIFDPAEHGIQGQPLMVPAPAFNALWATLMAIQDGYGCLRKSLTPNRQHTPGPWIVCDAGNDLSVEQDRATTDEPLEVALISYADAANARLIAAAPEMLAALDSVLRAPCVGSDGPGCTTIALQDFRRREIERLIHIKIEGP